MIKELPEANWTTFAAGAVALALLFLLPLLSRKIPAGLMVLFGAIALSAALDLEGAYGVAVVGTLPQGLPSFSLPDVPLSALPGMVVTAIGVLLVAYSEAIGVAHEFAEKHGYEVDADQELNAHGVVNLVSGLLGGMIAGGSMSASAVKEGAGARTQVANLIAWVVTIVTLLFLTPLFAPLPEAVLAALIIHALWHLVASRKLVQLRRAAPVEVWFGVITLWGVLLLDVLRGHDHRLAGLAALRDLPVQPRAPLRAGARARRARRVFGRDAAPGRRSGAGGADRAAQHAAVLRQRPHGQRCSEIHDRRRGAATAGRRLRHQHAGRARRDQRGLVVGPGEAAARERHGRLLRRRARADARAGRETGLLEAIGEDHVFPTVDAAVRHIEAATGPTTGRRKPR